MAPVFLTLDEVLSLHSDQVRRYGGTDGVRDLSVLSSALGAPKASFAGEYLHQSLSEMAAAYLYHLVRNHPFVDGNKRTALAAALLCLWLNGHVVEAGEDELTDLVLGVAAGRAPKSEVAELLRRHGRPRRGAR